MKGKLLDILTTNIKLKLNIILILGTLSILTFLYYDGDNYISNILEEQTPNIIVLNIDDPFEEDITTEETSKVETISYQPQNKVADLSSWYWPTSTNYLITTYYSTYHKAIDIYSYEGYNSNIYAANNGEVVEVKSGCTIGDLSCNGKAGNYIVINHNNNNYYTVYMHLNQINVKVGDIVSSGTVIGTMGNTGNVIPVPTSSNPYNGTHLHFCLYIGRPFQGGYAINPLSIY